MPYLGSNITSKIFHASIGSEILRIIKRRTDLINMIAHVNNLLIEIKKPGSECTRIFSLLKKIFWKHFKVFHQFADTAVEFIKLFSL